MKVMVCGGAGHIGSHTCVELANAEASQCVRYGGISVTGPRWSMGSTRVVHFAALKVVGESCVQPLAYFENNISGAITLLQAMENTGVNRLVFSSSATVYGDPDVVPVNEDAPLRVTNPYGRTKLVMEQLIDDVCLARPSLDTVVLRYFNPVGAHASGRIGEDPRGTPNNLMPYVSQVAVGVRDYLNVFGGDYPTRDSTGVREYIHVVDLARAHEAVELSQAGGVRALNLVTGTGYSVLELVAAFERASGRSVPYRVVARRPGILPRPGRTRPGPGRCLAGRRNSGWIAFAKTRGGGSRQIPRATGASLPSVSWWP